MDIIWDRSVTSLSSTKPIPVAAGDKLVWHPLYHIVLPPLLLDDILLASATARIDYAGSYNVEVSTHLVLSSRMPEPREVFPAITLEHPHKSFVLGRAICEPLGHFWKGCRTGSMIVREAYPEKGVVSLRVALRANEPVSGFGIPQEYAGGLSVTVWRE